MHELESGSVLFDLHNPSPLCICLLGSFILQQSEAFAHTVLTWLVSALKGDSRSIVTIRVYWYPNSNGHWINF